MSFFNAKLAEVVKRDPRYAYEAYEFVFQALHHTQKLLGREPPEEATDAPAPSAEARHHVSGPELLHGIRSLALQEFGLMARTVFHMWGVERTDDFGAIVFNLIEAELMSRTSDDSKADFHEVFNLDDALVRDYRIVLDHAE
jgi:uncharacterized repeat protein (TIGR04138 family)